MTRRAQHDHVSGKGEPLVAAALAAGATYETAAAAGDVALVTVKRRMADTAYRDHVRRLRADVQERALGILAKHAAVASLRLVALTRSASSELVSQKSARTILEMGLRMRAQLDLEERMERIEAALARQERERERRA